MGRCKGSGAKGWGGITMRTNGQYNPRLWDGKTLPDNAKKLYNYLKKHPTFMIKDYKRNAGCSWEIARQPFRNLMYRGLIVRREYWDVMPVPFGDEEINKDVYVKGRWADDAANLWRVPKTIRHHRNSPSKINSDNSDAQDYIIDQGMSNKINRDEILNAPPTEEEIEQAIFEYRVRQIESGAIVPENKE